MRVVREISSFRAPSLPAAAIVGNSSCGIAFMSVFEPRDSIRRFAPSVRSVTLSPETERGVGESMLAGTAVIPFSVTSPRAAMSTPASRLVERTESSRPTSRRIQERTGSDSFFPTTLSATRIAFNIFSFVVVKCIQDFFLSIIFYKYLLLLLVVWISGKVFFIAYRLDFSVSIAVEYDGENAGATTGIAKKM